MKLAALLFIFLTIPLAAAQSGSMTLLTVSEAGENPLGGTAELFLDIKPGSGSIYIDSLPLTKLDTQISTRFANEVACKFLEADCTKYDFFYKIRAGASIVGGPSAGAAIAVLTISTLGNIPLRDDVVITGTINSGGFVGPVAGTNAKILAAQEAGFKKVLVPEIHIPSNETSTSNFTIEVVEVISLEQALEQFTGRNFQKELPGITPEQNYLKIMEFVARALCERTLKINTTVEPEDSAVYNYSQERYGYAMASLEKAEHYSAASYCFTSNLRLRQIMLSNYSNAELRTLMNRVELAVKDLNQKVDERELRTISDLETYNAVKERLVEAVEYLEGENRVNLSHQNIAYAYERYYSGVAWSAFFGLKGPVFEMDEQYMKEACLRKVSEAEERISYVGLYLPNMRIDARKKLDYAYEDYSRADYELCIFKASQAKAEAEAWLTSLVVPQGQLVAVIDHKLDAAKKIILKQQKQGLFPILGYSYYEYADSIKETDPYSALTFVEYAVELSNLDNYFPEKKPFRLGFIRVWEWRLLLVFFAGIATGLVMAVIVIFGRKKPTGARRKARPSRT